MNESKVSQLNITLVDVTLRDGGIVNDFYFDDDFVKALYQANWQAGVDVMEMGYRASDKLFSREKFGKWKFCDEQDLRAVIPLDHTLKIAVMADVGRTDMSTFLPKEQSIIDIVRVACYLDQVAEAVQMVNTLHGLGYFVSCNIMAITQGDSQTVQNALQMIATSQADVIYATDSFGALYPDDVKNIINAFVQTAKACGKQVGFHAHNNQNLAFANTWQALQNGATFIDSTMGGMGRGAGNCSTEQMLGYLGGKYSLVPALGFLQSWVQPLKKQLKWGYDVPYLITGLANAHPRQAIDFIKQQRSDLNNFYQEVFSKKE